MRHALLLLVLLAPARAQQITIDRIEAMPALPADYHLRDWDRVTTGYDSLVFDPNRTGTYFPLVGLYSGTTNYPDHGAFGLETYVGSGNEVPGEAINVLPALVGSTWAGANKRAQYGVDWVLRAEEFFNRRPAEDVYLNSPTASSGTDWWYDTMPNVFFYQLRAQYPGTGDFERQFTTVADRWLAAIGALGGSATPWALPAINYRAFALETMSPLVTGVPEPEAAGAIAWILYSAYRETGQARYRIGAEQALEALVARPSNPSYELQLPYGTLAAAKMNAQLGTTYDLERLLTWSFEVGPLRNWGTLVGTWGGYSASGLVGEAGSNGYAFALNGFQHAAALVPVARYDDRFARALGRWMVNLASASRLFYRPFLPLDHQDSVPWSEAYDPRAVVAHEALRQTRNGFSPFATGDAIGGGWAPTNLSLYSSSSVGYLAAVVDSTEVPGILRLDLLKTDAYRGPAFASKLVYNPYDTAQTVTIPLTFGTYDVYDAVADAFLARGVQGSASVVIPPDAARVLVFPTSGGTATVDRGRLAVNNVVIDYRYGDPGDRLPRVKALVATRTTLSAGQTTTLYCTGADAEGAVTVGWSAPAGTLVPDGAQATWSSGETGDVGVTCTVTDGAGQSASETLTVRVVQNQPPATPAVTAAPPIVPLGGSTTLTCSADDPDGDALTYSWAAEQGEVGAAGAETTYTPPDTPGYWAVECTATDPDGASSVGVGHVTSGTLILDLGLDGQAGDASGFGHDGAVAGATATAGHDGTPDGALRFDGVDDVVTVESTAPLNPREAVSLSVWVRPDDLPAREAFVVSHGSWQNRWKLSVTPEGHPRWTVHTDVGIVDLDAPAALAENVYTHLAATYDGAHLRVFVNGQAVSERPHTGRMPATQLPLLLGQMLPGQAEYNFPGALDDVRVYNRALTASEVYALYTGNTAGEPAPRPLALRVEAPYPNPSQGRIQLRLAVPSAGPVSVHLVDVVGRRVGVLFDGRLSPGVHALSWQVPAVANGLYLLHVKSGDGAVVERVLVVR